MSDFVELRGEQIRQLVDAEQVFAAHRAARLEYERRFKGAMSWKRVRGADYLYRKQAISWKALGVRGAETELAHRSFHEGRTRNRVHLDGLAARLDDMAPINRAYGLGRMPVIAGRILRALDKAKLMGTAIDVVGTHALYAYERMAGVFVASDHLATGDIDLLYDSRARLRLLGSGVETTGLAGLLHKVDHSFTLASAGGFRAVNRDGFMVDLIQPTPKNRMEIQSRSRIGAIEDDLAAGEIEGLSWLVTSPKIETVVMDTRGYPLAMVTPDPRAFALHKLWLADRVDRDPLKRRRDQAQARMVAELLSTHLPQLNFDDPALGALPRHLRERLDLDDRKPARRGKPREPNW